MKAFPISIPACLAFWLGVAVTVADAREPVKLPGDLLRLEAKVSSVADKTMPATVALLSDVTGSSGSGVVVREDGLILTAAHVVQGAEDVLVVFPDGKQVAGKVLGANFSRDIAMVRITEEGTWPFVDTGASRPLQAGDWVVALGHSAGFDPARTPPVRFGRVVSKGPGNYLTSDCTLIGGDSGGPLFDLDGKLVGINSSIGRSLQNNNHAGIDGFSEDWDRLLKGDVWGKLELNPFDNPEKPVLGVDIASNRRGRGVLVDFVRPGLPAAKSGMKAGDLIVAIDESDVRDGGELLQLLAKRQGGDTVTVGVIRNNRRVELEVTLIASSELFDEE